MTKQLPALTSLRGIAALFILLHHITTHYIPELGNCAEHFSPILQKSYLWVDFFFILSGFIICHVYHDTFDRPTGLSEFRTYMTARFARIYPMHIIVLGGLIILELIYWYLYTNYGPQFSLIEPPFGIKHSIKTLVTNILLLHSLHTYSSWNEPAWAISAEWIMYFLLPLIILFTRRANHLIQILIIITAYSTLFIIIKFHGTMDVMSWQALIRCFAEVVIGVVTYRIFAKLPASNRFSNTPLFLWGVLICVIVTIGLPINHIFTVALFPVLIITAAFLEKGMLIVSKFPLMLGQISYSIYMIHWFLLESINRSIIWSKGADFIKQFNLSILCMTTFLLLVITIVSAFITWKFIEHPLRNRLKKQEHWLKRRF